VNLHRRASLIPRNNWDYGLQALFTALTNIAPPPGNASNIENVFHQTPIWTNTGRTSLYAILKSLELPIGAKVGVPLFCCSVVFNAICQAGLTPRFIDSNLYDCNISPDDLRKKRPGLAAVIAVHMFGNPCDIDEILDIAGPLPVIEDCAQSVLSTYKGKLTGLLSTASFFSFRCGKYISAGAGSAIFCREPELRQKIGRLVSSFDSWSRREMLTHSLVTFAKATLYNRPWYGLLGYPVGMRLDKKYNLTAKEGFETGQIASSHQALTEKRVARFQEKINLQREHGELLLSKLVPVHFNLPGENEAGTSNWFQFPLRFHSAQQREDMAGYLFERGIDTAKYLDGIASEASTRYGYMNDCPNAELLSKTILLVPIHYFLRSSDILYIARAINQASLC
jgi:dTDP-4-amino-4,6-dideoxygalactose transaminase